MECFTPDLNNREPYREQPRASINNDDHTHLCDKIFHSDENFDKQININFTEVCSSLLSLIYHRFMYIEPFNYVKIVMNCNQTLEDTFW